MYRYGNGYSPALYTQIQNYNGSFFPSTVHTWDNATTEYYTRMLTQRAISVFKWRLPDTICRDYFLYNLYLVGYLTAFYSKEYGIVAQTCGFEGWDLYYNPRWTIISNEFFNYERRLIDTDCVVFKLEPDYFGCFDVIQKYAEMLAQASQTMSMSYLNSCIARILITEDNKAAEQAKKIFDQIFSGAPIVATKHNTQYEWATEDPSKTFIVNEVLESMSRILDEFNRDIGIPVANTEKKERLITAEVNKRDDESRSRAALWLEGLQETCRKANEMFGGDYFSVDWRWKDESSNNDSRIIQL